MKHALLFVAFLAMLTGCGTSNLPVGKTEIQPAEVGNGGHGVKEADGKVYALDLWEMGIAQSTSIEIPSRMTKRMQSYRSRLEKTLSSNDFPLDALAVKLAEMDQIDSYLTNTILYAIESYNWSLVNVTFKLLPVEGDIMQLGDAKYVLAANRRGKGIYISTPVFHLMNSVNQVALILHEAIFSLLPPQRVLVNGEIRIKQDSVRARTITGLFFRRDLKEKLKQAGFGTYIGEHELPFLSSKMGLNEKDAAAASNGVRYASTFLLHQSSKYRMFLPKDLTGAVGSIYIGIPAQPGMGQTINVHYQDATLDEKLNVVCAEWGDGPSKRMDIDIVFYSRNEHEPLVELRFKQYQDRGQVYDFLEHTRTGNTIRMPVSEFNRNYDPERIASQLQLMTGLATNIAVKQHDQLGSLFSAAYQKKKKEACISDLRKTIPETFEMIFPHREQL